MLHFHPLTVKEIKRITPSSVTVTFDIPDQLKEIFTFIPGQHITIKKEFEGKEQRRSYSICSSPKSGEITIGIKKMIDGLFSTHANNQLRTGDILEVHPPEGRFTLNATDNVKNIIAFAAGSGITPIMSMVKDTLEQTDKNFVLVYGNKSPLETMFLDELISLEKQYGDRLQVFLTYSQTEEENAHFGRIERSTVNFVLKNKLKDTTFDAFYLCGPEPMIKTVSETLKENGIDDNKIHFELFTTSEEETVVDIESWPEGKTRVKVMVDYDETEFIMDKKERVLDAVLAQDIDAPYSCQGGICSSCIARLKEGKVEMVKNQILTDSEIEEGFILTCQSHPITDSISIDYDDV